MAEISTEFTRDLYAQDTSEAYLVLLDIETPEITDGILRLVNNHEDIVSNGETYTACAFRPILPDQKDTGTPMASLEIDNVDRRIGLMIRQMRARPKITMKVIRASKPDEIELEFSQLLLNSAEVNKDTVSGQIGMNSAMNQTFPKDTYTPSLFPGMF